ncbi:MAG: hypothetical protein IJU16_06660 [Clostridia bacterium]|nr:hypothetical protein [Clostridia bacterium]
MPKQILPDRERRPAFAVIYLVLTVIGALLTIGLYARQYMQPLLLGVFGTVALVLTVLAAIVWPGVRGLRIGSRVAGGLVVALMIVFAVVIATGSASADPLYVLGEFATWTAMLLQVLLAFFLPTAVMAASHGGRMDIVLLRVMAILNAVCVVYFMVYAATKTEWTFGLFDVLTEWPFARYTYAAFAVLLAGLSFVKAIYAGQPFRKKER